MQPCRPIKHFLTFTFDFTSTFWFIICHLLSLCCHKTNRLANLDMSTLFLTVFVFHYPLQAYLNTCIRLWFSSAIMKGIEAIGLKEVIKDPSKCSCTHAAELHQALSTQEGYEGIKYLSKTIVISAFLFTHLFFFFLLLLLLKVTPTHAGWSNDHSVYSMWQQTSLNVLEIGLGLYSWSI